MVLELVIQPIIANWPNMWMLWRKKYFLEIFVDLSKAFDTVDHKILITKLEKFGICGKNLLWFRSYLSDKKQCIKYGDYFNKQESTTFLQSKCGSTRLHSWAAPFLSIHKCSFPCFQILIINHVCIFLISCF